MKRKGNYMSYKGLMLGAAAGLAALSACGPANAGPSPAIAAAQPTGSAIVRAGYRHDRGYYDYGYGPYYGGGLFALPGQIVGGALGMAGGALAGAVEGAVYGAEAFSAPYYASGYYSGPYYGYRYRYGYNSYGGYGGYGGYGYGYGGAYEDSGVAACERNFRSFDPASGTYITYDGVEVLCPYLDR